MTSHLATNPAPVFGNNNYYVVGRPDFATTAPQPKTISFRHANALRQKYSRLMGKYDDYVRFMSMIAGRYGVRISNIKLPPATNAFRPADTKSREVTYVRKPNPQDDEIYEVISKAAPSIVLINAWDGKDNGWSGSGVIVDLEDAIPGISKIFPDGKLPPNVYGILTNNHVTPPEETNLLTATLQDGTVIEEDIEVLKSPKKPVGVQDRIVDASIILIRIRSAIPIPLPTTRIAKEPPRQGETVLTAGHPIGFPYVSFTRGIISNPAQCTSAGLAIQTDAEINPGNSGGALLNLRGELLGLTTFSYSGTKGLSFAPFIQKQVGALREIFWTGECVRGEFNFSVTPFDHNERRKMRFPSGVPGAKVEWVDHLSAAKSAGLRPNDVITRIICDDGTALEGNAIYIDNPFEKSIVEEYMHTRRPGSKIMVTVLRFDPKAEYKRDGKIYPYSETALMLPVNKFAPSISTLKSDDLGFLVEKLADKFIITDVDGGSPANRAGLIGKKWALEIVGAKEISDKPILIKDLETLKMVLIKLRELGNPEILLGVVNIANPAERKVFPVRTHEMADKEPVALNMIGIANYIAA